MVLDDRERTHTRHSDTMPSTIIDPGRFDTITDTIKAFREYSRGDQLPIAPSESAPAHADS